MKSKTAVFGGVSPFLDGDHQQIVEEEEMDGAELSPHVEERCSFGHFLEISSLLQISVLGDDRDRLATEFTSLK